MSMDTLVKKLLSDVEKLQEAEGGTSDILDEIHAFDLMQTITASASVKTVNEFSVSQSALPGMSVAGQAKGTFKVGAPSEIGVDLSGSGNHGTIYGTQRVGGKLGDGILLDGTNDYINCGTNSSLAPTAAITIIAWIWQTAENIPTGARRTVVSRYDGTNTGYILDFVDDSGVEGYRVHLGSTSYKYNTAPLTEQWVYFAATWDGSAVRLYLNDSELNNWPRTAAIPVSTDAFKIGYRSSANHYFNGRIDEVMVYNRALSPTEVSDRYNSGKGIMLDPAGETGLVGYWRFDPVRVGFADAG